MLSNSALRLFSIQCNFHATQRVRRTSQVYWLYSRLYSERSVNSLLSRFWYRVRTKLSSLIRTNKLAANSCRFLLSSAGLFVWKNGISDEEIANTVEDFRTVFPKVISKEKLRSNSDHKEQSDTSSRLKNDGWELTVVRHNFQVWRKCSPDNHGLYQYKVFGTFTDIPARMFFIAQYDTDYRKEWDKLVIKLDVIDKERQDTATFEDNMDSGSEVIHWIMNYPFPMYSREYCYVRRAVIDKQNNVMVFVSRAVNHPNCPVSDSYVRVEEYTSRMVIKPHRSFDDNGFDYVLTYFDDPKSAFPSPAYNWMACSGVPQFVERVHQAAVHLHKNGNGNLKIEKSGGKSSQSNQSPISNRDFAYA
ncbi:hypothetical protein B4U80_03572 [Leptotrombidium deliense]|uniref:Phosphatidylcholine transfer protein n=1 Tax=Leptotrombidium deliense TaxID=299467 RepID=A0A443SA61_9ACAR|nr:hypothetical protein B4U80_03572 [Leptotrombidium deliense]